MASVSTMKVPSSLFQVSLLFSVNEAAIPQQEDGKQFFKIKITADVTSSNPCKTSRVHVARRLVVAIGKVYCRNPQRQKFLRVHGTLCRG